MLRELEQGLVAHLKNSALADRLRQIATLPDLDGDSLFGRFGAEAPAVYVALGSGVVDACGVTEPTLGIACLARNSRSAEAARHGDGQVIGLIDLVEAVMTIVDGAVVGEQEYAVLRWDMLSSEPLTRKGLYAAVVTVRTVAPLPIEYTGEAR
jgi:hypothetical protein